MKIFLTSIFLFSTGLLFSQNLIMHEDTLYHFKIAARDDWQTGTWQQFPNLKFICRKPTLAENEKFYENYNVNTFQQKNLTLDKAVENLIKYNSQVGDYKLIEQGERSSNKCNLQWVLSSHTNELNNELVYNYTFIAYKNPIVYLITFTSNPGTFTDYKALYDSIADTFEITK